MRVPIPFSPAYALLLLALPLVWLLGRALAHSASNERAARPALALGIALSAWIFGVHIASLVFRSARAGLPVGTLAIAALGIFAEISRRKRAPLDRPQGAPPSPWMLITAALATAAMAPLALGYNFHDEILITGHLSIASEIQNGIYPPRHLTFPDTPLRYHYGFDLVSSSLTALFHVQVDTAIDIATLALFALAWCLFWTLGERLAGRAAAWALPLCALFGGGMPVSCDNAPASFVNRIVDVCTVGSHYLNPPIPSYFFQHPWSIGIPAGLTALVLFTSREPPSERSRLLVLAGCLAVLSLCQMTFFAACLPSFVVAEAFREGSFEARPALRMLGVAAIAAVAAKLMGGFLVSAPGLPSLSFTLRAGIGETWRETWRWNAQTFGLLLPLALLGFFRMRRDRVLFVLLACGAIGVVNVVRYQGSDDILKFATLATLMLAVPSSVALSAWLPRASTLPRASPWNTAAALALAFGTCFSGAVFVIFVTAGWPGIPGFFKIPPAAVSPAEARSIAWLRARIRPGEIVYRNATHTYAFAQWGGLPQPWIQWTAKAFGFPDDRIAARESLVRGAPAGVETYRREGFRFFVLDSTKEDAPLRKASEMWISAGRASRVATFEGLWIVEIETH